MLHLVLYGVLAIVVGGVLFAAAARFLPAGEQIAPPVRDEPPWELPPDRAMRGDDIDVLRLPVALRGYRFAETDQLLDRLAGELRDRDAELARLRGEAPVDEQVRAEEFAPVGDELPFDETTVDEDAAGDLVDEETAQYGAVVLVKSAGMLEEEALAADEVASIDDAAAEDVAAPIEDVASADEAAPVEEAAPADDELPPTDEVAAPVEDAAPVEEVAPVDDEVVPFDELFGPVEEVPVEEVPVEEVAPPVETLVPPDPVEPATSGHDDELADSLAVDEALDESSKSPATVELPTGPADEAPSEESTVEEPTVEEPTVEEPVGEEPAVEQPAAQDAAPPTPPPPPRFVPPPWAPVGQQSGHWSANAPPWAVGPAQGQGPPPGAAPAAPPPAAGSPADQPAESPKRRFRRKRS